MAFPPTSKGSPLEALSLDRFKGRTTLNEYVVRMVDTRQSLLQNNPNRLHWIMINEGANDARVSTDPTITFVSGWLLQANGGVIAMDWEVDGETVGYEVYAISNAVGCDIRIREVIII